ncbi:thiamine phosphate synthase [Bermanella sp. R86510]|uniref:thiamine phosphate synthase n=1 Tax=unclassified Bermanella TaxID=2627862 RepID=UPI0037CC7DED
MTDACYKPSVLCISGVDPMGLSGYQADLRALQSMGVHGMCVITALTSQTCDSVIALNPTPIQIFKQQLDAVYQQGSIKVIKLGLIASWQQCEVLIQHPIMDDVKVILDPVIAATHGDFSSKQERLKILKALLPCCHLVTPNLEEAQLLAPQVHPSSIELLAKSLLAQGTHGVLIKGGHSNEPEVDYFCQSTQGINQSFYLKGKLVDHHFNRGTGCTLASLIAASLAFDLTLEDSVVVAKMQLMNAWQHPFSIDGKHGSLILPKWTEADYALPKVFHSFSTSDNHALNITDLEHIQLPACDKDLGLYPIVDRADWLARLLPLGIRIIQLRIKDLTGKALEHEIATAVALSEKYNACLFINDYWQLAIKYKAYGVHLGQEDLTSANLKQIAQSNLRLGLSSHCYFEVARAMTIKPSYLAYGPIYSTQTKQMPWQPQGLKQLDFWRRQLPHVPMVAIGGIHGERVAQVKQTGVDAIAMISAITQADNPEQISQDYQAIIEPRQIVLDRA